MLARIAVNPARDRNLVAINADHLFQPSILNLVSLVSRPIMLVRERL